jgi:TonB family protein
MRSCSSILDSASNSALDLTARPVTPVARAQRARQPVPQVSASVRRNRCQVASVLVSIALSGLLAAACTSNRGAAAQDSSEKQELVSSFLRELNLASPGDPVLDDLAPENRGRVTSPVLLKPRQPVYPETLRLERKQGQVLIGAVIERDGSVGETRVLLSSGETAFDLAAVDAVRGRLYRPGTLSGGPVRVVLVATVSFNLQ